MAALLVAIALAACGPNIPDRSDRPNGGNGEQNGETIEGVWPQVADVLTDRCASCHSPGAQYPTLIGVDAHSVLLGSYSQQVPHLSLVQPGDPDASYLFIKLLGLQADACIDSGIPVSTCGTEMPPPPEPPLPQATLGAVRSWIAAGATEDE